MKKAIRLLENREEKIVTADEVYKNTKQTIPISKKIFICLECGEFVGFVSRSKETYEPYFKHRKKLKGDHYCDLRNDNDENTNFYEKVGSSLYLKNTFPEVFELLGGFRKCDLKEVYENNLNNKIEILSTGNKKRMEYIIDTVRFNSNIKNFLKINFISNVYTIKYSNQYIEDKLRKKWGKKIEGFKYNKAMFSNNGRINKKIRINSEIHTDMDYYAVVNKYFKIDHQDIINWEYVGDLQIRENIKYKVFKIIISTFSNDEYFKLYNYFRKNFFVNLVKRASLLDLIWPPLIQNGDEYYSFFNYFRKFYLLEKNFNDENSNLLVHSISDSRKLESTANFKNVFLYEINNMSNVSISANNYYTDMVIDLNFLDKNIVEEPDLKIRIYSGKVLIKKSKILIEDIEEELKILSNFRTDIIQYRKGVFFRRYKMRSEILIVNDYKSKDKFYYTVGNLENKILELDIGKPIDNNEKDKLVYYMKKYSQINLVNTPQWIHQLKYKFKSNSLILNYLDEYYFSGKIPKYVLNKLRKYLKGVINA